MRARSPNGLVDEMVRLAGRAEPPPMDDATARRIVESAMRTVAPPHPVQATQPARRWKLAVAVAAAAAALWWLVPRSTVAPPEPSVIHFTLPTGDRLVGVAGAQFDLERLAADDRRLRLRSGTVLFDVAQVVTGQRFQVTTAHLVATAKGTVFSVETDEASSHVRVYEGIVEVEQDGYAHWLPAGTVWDSGARTTAIALQRPSVLARSVEVALRERASATMAAAAKAARAPETAAAAADPAAPAQTAALEAVAAAAPAAPAQNAEPPPDRAPGESLAELLTIARADVVAGKLEHALSTAQRAAARGPWTGAWWQLVGDASRGLGRTAEAADAFDHAARDLTGAERSEAGYSAAYLRFHDLREGDRALASLDASSADGEGSPLAERASGLRVQILVALDRRDAARAVAAHYLERFPHADLRAYMLSLTRP